MSHIHYGLLFNPILPKYVIVLFFMSWSLPIKGVNYFSYIFNNPKIIRLPIVWFLLDTQVLVWPSENTQETSMYSFQCQSAQAKAKTS